MVFATMGAGAPGVPFLTVMGNSLFLTIMLVLAKRSSHGEMTRIAIVAFRVKKQLH